MHDSRKAKNIPPASNLKKMSRHLMCDITGPTGSRPELKYTRTEAKDTTAGLPVVMRRQGNSIQLQTLKLISFNLM